jgi:hypothetical protein
MIFLCLGFCSFTPPYVYQILLRFNFHVYCPPTIQFELIWSKLWVKGFFMLPSLFLNPLWKNPHLAVSSEESCYDLDQVRISLHLYHFAFVVCAQLCICESGGCLQIFEGVGWQWLLLRILWCNQSGNHLENNLITANLAMH